MTKIEKQIRYVNRVPMNSIEELKLVIGKDPNDYAILLGKSSKADGDAREYYWDATSIAANDDDSVIKPTTYTTEPGRWLKVVKVAPSSIIVGVYKKTLTPDGISAIFNITHNLGTDDVDVTIIDRTTTLIVRPVVSVQTINNIVLTFQSVPSDEIDYRVIIIGV